MLGCTCNDFCFSRRWSTMNPKSNHVNVPKSRQERSEECRRLFPIDITLQTLLMIASDQHSRYRPSSKLRKRSPTMRANFLMESSKTIVVLRLERLMSSVRTLPPGCSARFQGWSMAHQNRVYVPTLPLQYLRLVGCQLVYSPLGSGYLHQLICC